MLLTDDLLSYRENLNQKDPLNAILEHKITFLPSYKKKLDTD